MQYRFAVNCGTLSMFPQFNYFDSGKAFVLKLSWNDSYLTCDQFGLFYGIHILVHVDSEVDCSLPCLDANCSDVIQVILLWEATKKRTSFCGFPQKE